MVDWVAFDEIFHEEHFFGYFVELTLGMVLCEENFKPRKLVAVGVSWYTW